MCARAGALLLMVFAAVNLVVTLYFQASVSAQRNAYASGVLVLMSSAAVVAVLGKSRAACAGTEKGSSLASPRFAILAPAGGVWDLFHPGGALFWC